MVGATALVTFAGAAGMYSFESPTTLREQGYDQVVEAGGGLNGYGEAVWSTAMTMTMIRRMFIGLSLLWGRGRPTAVPSR